MDSNNSTLQVYDIDELDFIVADEAHLQQSDIEKTKSYVGKGKK